MSAPKSYSSEKLKKRLEGMLDTGYDLGWQKGQKELGREISIAMDCWVSAADDEDVLQPWEVKEIVDKLISQLTAEK